MFWELVTFELALIGLGAGVELSLSKRRVYLWEFMAVYSSMGLVLWFALYMEFGGVAEPESKMVCTVPFGIWQGICLQKAWALRLSLGFSNLRPSPSHLKAVYKAWLFGAQLCWLDGLRLSLAHHYSSGVCKDLWGSVIYRYSRWTRGKT